MSYTNTNLIEEIKRLSAIPENSDWTDQKILDVASKIVRNLLAPALLKIREEFFVFDYSYSITQNQSKYRISPRAMGGTLRDVTITDSSGNVKSLPQLNAEEIRSTSTGTPSAFYLKSNNIVLYPTPSSTVDTLQANILIRPSRLTEVANTGKITAIDTVLFQATVDNLPTTWTTGTVLDFVKGTSPFEILDIDYTVVSASGLTVTFSSLPSTLAVGDYVTVKEETPIPNLPEDLFPCLIQLTSAELLISIGQDDEAQVCKAEGAESLQQQISAMTPRVSGSPRKFKTRLI